jgi:hypothetical protein
MRTVKPNRVTRTYAQHLTAAPEAAFPLSCPVREADWIQGRDPALDVSASWFAERDRVITASAEPSGKPAREAASR